MSRILRASLGLIAALAVAGPGLAVAAPKKPAPKKPAPKPAAPKADIKAGKEAFTAEGCAGCHATKDVKGGNTGPDLSAIAAEHKPAEIQAYILKPKAGSIMPAFSAKDAKSKKVLADLVGYLATQK